MKPEPKTANSLYKRLVLAAKRFRQKGQAGVARENFKLAEALKGMRAVKIEDLSDKLRLKIDDRLEANKRHLATGNKKAYLAKRHVEAKGERWKSKQKTKAYRQYSKETDLILDRQKPSFSQAKRKRVVKIEKRLGIEGQFESAERQAFEEVSDLMAGIMEEEFKKLAPKYAEYVAKYGEAKTLEVFKKLFSEQIDKGGLPRFFSILNSIDKKSKP